MHKVKQQIYRSLRVTIYCWFKCLNPLLDFFEAGITFAGLFHFMQNSNCNGNARGNFKSLFLRKHKVQSLDIWQVALYGGRLSKLFKSWPMVQNWPRHRGHLILQSPHLLLVQTKLFCRNNFCRFSFSSCRVLVAIATKRKTSKLYFSERTRCIA